MLTSPSFEVAGCNVEASANPNGQRERESGQQGQAWRRRESHRNPDATGRRTPCIYPGVRFRVRFTSRVFLHFTDRVETGRIQKLNRFHGGYTSGLGNMHPRMPRRRAEIPMDHKRTDRNYRWGHALSPRLCREQEAVRSTSCVFRGYLYLKRAVPFAL